MIYGWKYRKLIRHESMKVFLIICESFLQQRFTYGSILNINIYINSMISSNS